MNLMNVVETKTLVILKPDSYENKVIGKVISEFEEKKITIIAMKMLKLSQEEAEEFYAVHKGKNFHKSLAAYVSRDKVVVLVLQGFQVIEIVREMIGATDPKQAKKTTIRGKYGSSLDANVVHASDSENAAKDEINFFFSKMELSRN